MLVSYLRGWEASSLTALWRHPTPARRAFNHTSRSIALQTVIAFTEDVSEDLRDLHVEESGSFILDPEGVDTHLTVVNPKSAFDRFAIGEGIGYRRHERKVAAMRSVRIQNGDGVTVGAKLVDAETGAEIKGDTSMTATFKVDDFVRA